MPTVERGLREVVFCSMEMAGRQALDGIDVGLLHQLQELAGIGREGFDIAALALGIDGVEGERGLAGTRQAGDHHQLVARHVDVDVLQIMLARAADGDPRAAECACHVLPAGNQGAILAAGAGKSTPKMTPPV